MTKLGTLTLKGASGDKYTFNIYPYDTSFKAIGAVYAVTERYENNSGGHSHTTIYIGQTDDLSTRFDDHHKEDCFEEKEANCICVHADNSKKSRLSKEKDLIEGKNPPCNG